jgi:23S rRNA pseudouridine2604 synthase
MTSRPKISVKNTAAPRDPRRRPVRGGMAPLPPVRDTGDMPPRPAPRPPPAAKSQQARPPVSQRPTQAPYERPRHERPRDERPPFDRSQNDRPPPRPAARPPAKAQFESGAPNGTRLSKILSDRGTASRREADDWIAAGWVRVDGRVAILGQRVRGDERIEIDPAAKQQQQRSVTILINKPIGYVSGQAEDGYEPAVVLVKPENRWAEDRGLAIHPAHFRGLAPAGRLDIDSTGMLVLTQDGRVARHLIGEDSDVEKEYLVRVEPAREGSFKPEDIERLRHGLELDERRLKPAKVSWANEDQLRIVLREGRKRQIRRMCELVGLKVTGLKRVRIGSVALGKLPMGQWRYLRDDERF